MGETSEQCKSLSHGEHSIVGLYDDAEWEHDLGK